MPLMPERSQEEVFCGNNQPQRQQFGMQVVGQCARGVTSNHFYALRAVWAAGKNYTSIVLEALADLDAGMHRAAVFTWMRHFFQTSTVRPKNENYSVRTARIFLP